jgi:type III secretion system (T3SS) SseB-like protein
MLVSADDDSPGDFLRGLLCGTFWFPVNYHPELGDPLEPGPNDKIPFWIGDSEEGKFIPIYSSPEVMRIDLERFDHPHSRARMNGGDLIVALGSKDYPVIINPCTKASIVLPAPGRRALAVGLVNAEKRHGRKIQRAGESR